MEDNLIEAVHDRFVAELIKNGWSKALAENEWNACRRAVALLVAFYKEMERIS